MQFRFRPFSWIPAALAAATVDLLTSPATIAEAKAEFTKATGGKPWISPLPADAKPAAY